MRPFAESAFLAFVGKVYKVWLNVLVSIGIA
jgi:hypothetical protein